MIELKIKVTKSLAPVFLAVVSAVAVDAVTAWPLNNISSAAPGLHIRNVLLLRLRGPPV